MLNRPFAFLQWVQKVTIPERYVLMSEPDHLWLKPLGNIMLGERPVAFPFFYIEPWKDEYLPITRKHVGPISKRQAEEIAPIGWLLCRLRSQTDDCASVRTAKCNEVDKSLMQTPTSQHRHPL